MICIKPTETYGSFLQIIYLLLMQGHIFCVIKLLCYVLNCPLLLILVRLFTGNTTGYFSLIRCCRGDGISVTGRVRSSLTILLIIVRYSKVLEQREELEQKHLHLLQILESERQAKWHYVQQTEELATSVKELRAEVLGRGTDVRNSRGG